MISVRYFPYRAAWSLVPRATNKIMLGSYAAIRPATVVELRASLGHQSAPDVRLLDDLRSHQGSAIGHLGGSPLWW